VKPQNIFTIVLALAWIILSFSGCGEKSRSAPLADYKTKTQMTTVNKVSMFSLVRKALALYPDVDKALSLPVEKGLLNNCDREVFVTIFHEGSPQITGVGAQGCMQERLLLAVANLTSNPTFKNQYLLNLDTVTVKIDIVYRRNALNTDKEIEKIKIEPGLDGLILQDGQKMHYQLPTDFIHFGWEPETRGKNLRGERNKIMFKYLCRQGGHGAGSYKSYPIYRFRTISLIQHKPDVLPLQLFRGNLLPVEFRSTDMARGAAGAGDWLIENIEPTGRFSYLFDPTSGEKSSFFDYNVVRHAGCVYSLLYLYNQSLEPRFLEKGMVSLKFLQRHLKKPLLEPDLLAVKHPVYGTYALGSTALTLIALCELPDKYAANVGVTTTNSLAKFLLKMQMDNGGFYGNYLQKLADVKPSRPPRYAIGESLLALVRYYVKNPNVDWLEAANKAAQFQIDRFNATGQVDSWTIQGLAELFRINPRPEYSQAVFDMADIFLDSQYDNKSRTFPDYAGGFKNSRPPRSTPASSRTEALLAARNLSYFLGKSTRKYDQAILLAARFILWNQYRSDNSYFIGLPDSAKGAISGGLIDPVIRMDYCQHAIIALTGAYKVAAEKEDAKSVMEKIDSSEKSGKSK